MSNGAEPANRWELTEAESRMLREFVTAVVLHGHVTAEAAGLHPIDIYVMNLLDLDGESTPGELAKRTALTTGAVTKLVDRLARLGLVRRTPDEHDRRRVKLSVVDDASEQALGERADVFTPMAKRMDHLISSYPKEHREVVLDFFVRAAEQLQGATEELQATTSDRSGHKQPG